MRLLTRLAGASAAGLLLLGGSVTLAGQAVAVPPVTLTGSAPAMAHGAGTLPFTYTIDLPVAVDSTVLTTHQDAALPASVSGVTLDGSAVPQSQVSRPDSVDIAIQTGPLATDGLSAGTHTITFLAAVGAGAASDSSSTATLSWTEATVPDSVTSQPVLVALNQPDIAVALTPGAGEEQLGFLGTGSDLAFVVDVANLGYGTPQTTIEVDLPVGTTLGANGVVRDAGGPPLTCTPDAGDAQHLLCDLGTVLHTTGTDDPTIVIDVTTTAAAPIGAVAPITVSAMPNPGEGTDTDQTNNSVTARFQFSGSARLSYTVTAAKTKVALGSSTTVKLTVHNAGPQPANETIAFSVLAGQAFSITGFTGNTTLPPSVANLAGAPKPAGTDEVLWYVGTIPAGRSVSAVLTIKATKLGSSNVGLFAVSTATDPGCPDLMCSLTSVMVSAVPVPIPVPVVAVHVATPAGGAVSPLLANTGSAAVPTLGLGGALLLIGSAMLVFARRRRATA